MLANFAVLPPEVNSARMFVGAGPGSMLAAAAAWDELAGELQAAMTSFGSVTLGLAGGSWLGPASVAMTAAAAPYVEWLGMSAAQAAEAAGLARVAAGAFEAARAATVDLVLVAANRVQLVSQVASNLFGQNAPAIAAIEATYEQMWAQDVAAMVGYHEMASALAAQLSPWQQGLQSALGAVSASVALPNTQTMSTAVAGTAAIATTRAATAVNDVALVMGGSGLPIPGARYVNAANLLFIQRSAPVTILEALFTPQGLYPVTGTKSLTFDISVAQGLTILDTAIRQQIAAGNSVTVFGYSQSATISSLEMLKLASSVNPPTPDQLSFVLAANPNNPNGGIAARFAGLSLPSLGATASGATPHNLYPTSIYTIEYDGVADFPRYPINILADLNALAGIYYLHPTYMMLTPEHIDSAIQLTNTVGPTMTNYYIIPTKNLPLLEPLRALPIMGNPLADLIQPNLKVLVNLGYGDPAYGYSTTAPNVATPFELFPPVSPLTVASHLVAGTQQGVNDFAYGISRIQLPAPPALHNPMMAGPTPAPTPGAGLVLSPPVSLPSIDTAITDFQAANTRVTNAMTRVVETSYGTVLPTVDVLNTMVTTVPSYNLNLFLEGIKQAVRGDPMGLVNAVGYPIAADTALLVGAGGIELLVFIGAAQRVSNIVSTF